MSLSHHTGGVVAPYAVISSALATDSGIDSARIAQEFHQLSRKEKRVFRRAAHAFLEDRTAFEASILNQIAARHVELGTPLLRAELRDFYLHTLPCLLGEDQERFIAALDRALDHAEQAGHVRGYDKDLVERTIDRTQSFFTAVWQGLPSFTLPGAAAAETPTTQAEDTHAKIVVITGPRMEYVQQVTDVARQKDPNALIWGDGKSLLEGADMKGKIHPKAHIHVRAHGNVVNNVYGMELFKEATPEMLTGGDVFFDKLKRYLGDDFSGVIHLHTCHSNAAVKAVQFLPPKAFLVTSVHPEEEGLMATSFQETLDMIAHHPEQFLLINSGQLVFTTPQHQLTCTIAPISFPPQRPEALRKYIQNQLRSCAIPEIKKAAEILTISPAQFAQYQQEAFVAQAARGNLEYVKKCVEKKLVDPNAPIAEGTTALMMAASWGQTDVVRFLISRTDPNRVDSAGETALCKAVENGHKNSVDILIADERTNLDQGGNKAGGVTPLTCAAKNGNADIALALLRGRRKASLDHATPTGITPLTIAVLRGKPEMVGILLREGADPNKALLSGETALNLAALEDRTEIIEILLKAKRKSDLNQPNAQGKTPLIVAVSRGYRESAHLLIEAGADPSLKAKNGDDALTIAKRLQHPGLIELLEKAIAKKQTPPPQADLSLLAAARDGQIDIVRALLKEKKADPNQRNEMGATPLMAAVMNGRVEAARVLLENGADPTLKTSNGLDALSIAKEMKHQEFITLLEKAIAKKQQPRTHTQKLEGQRSAPRHQEL